MPILAGKSVVITGAGNGLGAAFARLAAQEGAAVVVNDIDPAAAGAVAGSIVGEGGQAVAHACDVSDWRAVGELFSACADRFGGVDGLINNAGVQSAGKPWESTERDVRAAVETNVVGMLTCGIQAMRVMVGQGHGAIVNVTSGAHQGLADMSVYGATKGAVASVTHCWAIDLQGTGVRVNAVSPLAATGMSSRNASCAGYTGDEHEEFMRRFPPPEHSAPVAIYLLSDASRDVTGQIVRIDAEALTLVAHPPLLSAAAVASTSWTVDRVAAEFSDRMSGLLLPLGMKALGADGRLAVVQNSP